jgi:putative Ca2+/H+ antiporter (TMEM165/GDT1 family)
MSSLNNKDACINTFLSYLPRESGDRTQIAITLIGINFQLLHEGSYAVF